MMGISLIRGKSHLLLQSNNLRVDQGKEPCIRVNIRKLNRELYTGLFTFVRCGSHWGGSPQNRLGDEQTCGTTLASAYVLRCLSVVWSQL